MHNEKNDISKLLEAIEAGNSLMNKFVTPEVEKNMTPEQLDLLEEAREVSGKNNLKRLSKKLERINETLRRNATTNNK